jgi:dethiobiotin synthetase
MSGLFVTGTDTGVGKTVVSCAITAALTRRGYRLAVLKPCETGDGDDAQRLIAATARPLPLHRVSPYRFALPASPELAAQAAATPIDLARIHDGYQELAVDADLALVEGAGGLLVPIGNGRTIADLASLLGLPLLLVARPSLGTINHTLLTLEAARRRGLAVLGVVFSRSTDTQGPDEPSNPATIARYGEVSVFGTLPRLDDLSTSALADAAERHLELDRLLALLVPPHLRKPTRESGDPSPPELA